MGGQPKVTHRNSSKSLRQYRTAAARFMEALAGKVEGMAGQGDFDSKIKMISEKPEDLLRLREQLGYFIKTGMYMKKDCELEIALMAILVWANRKQSEGEVIFDMF